MAKIGSVEIGENDGYAIISSGMGVCAKGHDPLVWNTYWNGECPACVQLDACDTTESKLRKQLREVRKDLKLARYQLRDAKDELSKYKSDNAEFLAMKKQARDAVSERIK